jgi:hypothetical protein
MDLFTVFFGLFTFFVTLMLMLMWLMCALLQLCYNQLTESVEATWQGSRGKLQLDRRIPIKMQSHRLETSAMQD